jgi:hypothetical protein
MRYSHSLSMRPATIGAEILERTFPVLWVPCPFPHAPVWQRLGQPFDRTHFLAAHPPVQLGHLMDVGVKEAEGVRAYLRTPIKAAGTDTVQIPTEMAPILPVIEHALETFAAWYPDWTNRHVHVTWEAGWVEEGTTQRVPGWHVDGFQGVRQAPHASEASVLWADALPTQYCVQPFFLDHLDPSRHNVQDAMVNQAQETNAYTGLPAGLYLIDPYCVHRAAVAPARTWRNFVRVTVADVRLDDPGNTRNVGLKGPQETPARLEVRDRLFAPPPTLPWDTLGFVPVARSAA